MSINSFVDAAVDKAADLAKQKVKSYFGGGGRGDDDKDDKEPSGLGGIGGFFSSSNDSDKNEKEKKGLFGLFSDPENETNPGPTEGAGGSGECPDFNSAVDELVDF